MDQRVEPGIGIGGATLAPRVIEDRCDERDRLAQKCEVKGRAIQRGHAEGQMPRDVSGLAQLLSFLGNVYLCIALGIKERAVHRAVHRAVNAVP